MAATDEQMYQIYRDMGYTGEFGAGGGQAWLDQDPNRRAQMEKYRLAREGGYTGSFAGGAYENQINGTQVYNQNGVVPVGMVEPLNDFQKQGLSSLATPYVNPYESGALNAYNSAISSVPSAQDAFGKMDQYTSQGTQDFTDADFSAGISRYMNPYQQQVVDASVAKITEQGDIARNRLMAVRPGSSSFGTTSQGVQQGMLTKDLLTSIGDTTGSLNYAGFNNAANMTTNQFNQDRSRDMGAGQQYAQQGFNSITSMADLARLGMAGGQAGQQLATNNATNQINAGGMIQNQNQNMLNVVNAERNKMLGFDEAQLAQLAQYLGQIPSSGTNTGAVAGTPNAAMQAGGALMSSSGFLGNGLSSLFSNPAPGANYGLNYSPYANGGSQYGYN